MKKNIFYILILVILIGLFISASQVQAEGVGDPCNNGHNTLISIKGDLQCQGPAPLLSSHPINTCPSGQVLGTDNTCLSDKTYHLLAPLPCTGTGPDCVGGKLVTFDPTSTDGQNSKLGEYLNLMIRLFIGICAVLAVIMIVMGGIQYMTTELISSKEAGRERIKGALFGLLLALGAWTILNTINPDILKSDLKTLEKVTVDVKLLQDDLDSSPPSLTPFTGTLPSGPVGACTEGVTKSATGIVACKNIATNVDKMISDAKAAGLTIWGGGFRTIEQQTALRIKNCNGNTTDRNAQCTTATAVPGASRHEAGLALDLTCGGQTIQTQDNSCFKWLQANASKYGLQNLKIGNEPWHWSVDGR